MTGRGHQIFADGLTGFAAGHADPRVTAVAERTAAPVRVGVAGRRGVGRSTVARALAGAGGASRMAVTEGADSRSDVVVYVTAEVIKPEDTEAIAAAGRPVVAVLTKADLVGAGWAAGGPIAAARARCAELAPLAGAPIEPMVGLLAVAARDGLDGEAWAALQALASCAAGTACLAGSYPEFLAAAHTVPTGVRLRLLDCLDVFGVALGMAAFRRGRTPAQVRSLFHRISGVDAVLDGIAAAGAEVRYRRVLDAVADLEALAVTGDRAADRISAFLCHDDTVVARMAAAMDVAGGPEARSLSRRGDGPAAHLRTAVRWQRYGRASAAAVDRACGADVARGSLRLWSRGRGSLPGEWS